MEVVRAIVAGWPKAFVPFMSWVGELRDPATLKADVIAGITVALVLVQRLARRLCPHCTVDAAAPELMQESLIARELYDPRSSGSLPRATGCEACDQTGFLGRVAVVESLQLTDQIRAMLMANRTLDEVMRLAQETGAWIRFPHYASFMMQRRLIGPAEALLAVAT